jgi:SAM-dependent methyltransferase
VTWVEFLRTPRGAELLAQAACMPPDRLTRLQRLRREIAPELAAAVVEQLELRARARSKFASAGRMFFTREGLEQSTTEAIARYRAARFPADVPILDACCGIGGDALALATRGQVLAVDLNPLVAACARTNVSIDAVSHPVRLACADVTTLDLSRLRHNGFAAAFFDPSRRVDGAVGGRRRARNAAEYAPPLSWLRELTAHFTAVGAKVSPALDDEALAATEAAVEFISERGECKEAALWYGDAAATLTGHNAAGAINGYAATVLRPDRPSATLTADKGDEPTPPAVPRAWLYEPDPAVIRAHLVGTLANRLGATPLEPQIAYLTADHDIETPFATGYRVLEAMPFNLKHLQAWLRRHGRRVEVVKRRGVPLEPEEMRRRLAHADLVAAPSTILVLTPIAGKPFALLCDPPICRNISPNH